MPAPTSPDLLAVFDRGPLNARYWTSFILLAGVYVLDFFDFFLIAFILAVIGPRWRLTYGQAALILYGSGVGAILGSLVWGSLSDVFGRKLQTVTGTLICGVAAGLIGLLPTGAYGAVGDSAHFRRVWSRRRDHPGLDHRRRDDPDPLA